ncbi:hypothetical protein PIB30_054611 [Stylosanthes scabra]|uniref:Uncharacterized protein n=1 Tax=Stylosanthes scabra TaxID=79078 RepID=A0ABU6SIT6_9FABA|nr:hypothetical protein [Stylosanthes scabra]
MRKVKVAPSPEQQDLLNRSVVAKSVKPIKFGSVVQGFKDLAKEFGRLECRDFGPLKCITRLRATHDTDSTSDNSLPPGFEDFKQRDANIRSDTEKRAIDSKENDETDDIEYDAEESFTCDDEEDEDIEEAKNTLQVCEKTRITFNEDEDAVLAKMTKKKKNNGKCRYKKLQLQGGLKLSKILLMPVAS